MLLSDVSVKRPVFASVLAAMMAIFGLFAYDQLTTREYPDITPARVSVSTGYPGASADIIESRITQVIESELSGIEGIKSMSSRSIDGRSSINIEFEISRDIDQAANDVRERVSRIVQRMPREANEPRIQKADSDAQPIIFISLASDKWSTMELTDYAARYVKDRFAVIPGVAAVNVFGGGSPAMRIWLDKKKLVARDLTVLDVVAALREENIELPAGRIESQTREFPVRVSRAYENVDDFRQLVIARGDKGQLVRLSEVAEVSVDRANFRRIFQVNGQDSMAIGVVKQSSANTVDVLDGVHKEIERLKQSLPAGVNVSSSGDASVFIRAAIKNVYGTIILAVALVALVLWLFLGNWRALVIPVVCIPLSLLGSFIALWMFGYSINLITLLAMVLSIGMVVDDAIVVLENIYRRIESGEAPLLAAYNGARQVGFAVIATTIVLVAVFVPVGLVQDNSGKIFSELAVTISSAVICSTILALSIVPMMCSKLFRRRTTNNKVVQSVDRGMEYLSDRYQNILRRSLVLRVLPVLIALCSAFTAYYLFQKLDRDYSPKEDQAALFGVIRAEEGTSVHKMREIIDQLNQPLEEDIENGELTRALFISPSFGSPTTDAAFSRLNFVDSRERDESVFDKQKKYMAKWSSIPGIRTFLFSPNGLNRGGGDTPVQFVIQGNTYENLLVWRDLILDEARASGLFSQIQADLKETQQQVRLRIDKDRAASLGLTINDIGSTLQAMMAEQEVSQYVRDGYEYPVIIALNSEQRNTSEDIKNIFVRSKQSGELISLANVITLENRADIPILQRYNRLRAVTISANLSPDVSLGEALEFLENTTRNLLPDEAKIDYKGESLEYKESTGGLLFVFGFALVVLFLVMAAQFESFIHPTVILCTVPLALAGGILGLWVTQTSFNIFSQIGMLILIGIATKNGILLVEFINQCRDKGMEFSEAIITACRMRLRPVVMTTVSTLVGAIPLVMAVGPGETSRNILGVVILFGVSLSALLTLFVIPGFYQLLARRTGSPEAVANELARLKENTKP